MKSKHTEVPRATVQKNGRVQTHLGPETENLGKFPPLWAPVYQHDVMEIALSTVARILRHSYTASTENRIETNNTGILAAASTTEPDLNELRIIAALHPELIRVGNGVLPRRECYHPNPPTVLVEPLGRGVINGLAGDPLRAIEVLQTNPSILKGLCRFSNRIVEAYHSYRMVGTKTVFFGAFAGSRPLEMVAVERVARQVSENWRVYLDFLPSEEEPLGRANARGELYKLIVEGVPANHLRILKQNTKRGSHEDDDALIHGMKTLTGTAPNGRELDGGTLLHMLRRNGCGWVEAHPEAIALPLGLVGKRWLFWDKKALVKVPEYDGSRMLEMLLKKARTVLEREEEGFHVLTVAGLFRDEEIAEFKQLVIRQLKPGHVVPVINRISPRVERATGRWTMCDFITSSHLPRSVVEIVQRNTATPFQGSGVDPQQFVATTPRPKEADIAEQVAEALAHILRGL